jgi:hypothetical protein
MQSKPLKSYTKPTLMKGPVLTRITAAVATSQSGNVCWVARAAFGDADIRWLIFRAWLLDDAPIWFRRLYIRHGEAVGAWLTGQPRTRGLVRAAMAVAINRKLRR